MQQLTRRTVADEHGPPVDGRGRRRRRGRGDEGRRTDRGQDCKPAQRGLNQHWDHPSQAYTPVMPPPERDLRPEKIVGSERAFEIKMGGLGGFELRPTRLFVWKGAERGATEKLVSLADQPVGLEYPRRESTVQDGRRRGALAREPAHDARPGGRHRVPPARGPRARRAALSLQTRSSVAP